MRRGFLRAVSSALLLVSLVSMSHPDMVEPVAQGLSVGSFVSGAVISEFYPCELAGDEYFTISCLGDTYSSLRNWSVTDGEGTVKFLTDFWLFPGTSVTVSDNATSYWYAYERLPDLVLDSSETSGLAELSGSFRLADAGDSLTLISPDGGIVDQVVYGSTQDPTTDWVGPPVPSMRKGEVAKRLESAGYPADTDSAQDWQPFREYRYGYTEFPSQRFEVSPGDITAFTSPDCSLEVVCSTIDAALNAISICTYEFSSAPVCERLVRAMSRGVELRLLVDGAPAGGMREDELVCLSVLSTAGAQVLTVNGNLSKGIVQHVGALHAKYLVVDLATCIVMSENLVEDGLPQNRVIGNRGWGLLIRSSGLADYLLKLFDSDSRLTRRDVGDWRSNPRYDVTCTLKPVPASDANQGLLGALRSAHPASATVVVSPDGSIARPYLLDYMRARHSILVEQFQADLFWASRWSGEKYLNPMIQSLLASESRGVVEKVLLDSSWFNQERNQKVVECLAGNSTSGASFVGLLDDRSPVSLLHNKGAVVDGMITAVTSNNWVCASFSKNRELAVVLESSEIASHFISAFDCDSIPDETPPMCDAGPDLVVPLGASIVIDAAECSDDRQLLELSWDSDADGIIDSHNDKLLFRAQVVGDHVVVLKATDAWGNSASDEVRVSVISPASQTRESVIQAPQLLWLAPVVVAFALLVARLARRRK